MADEQHTQHLYLLFDDWHSGYSIRKVSLSRRSGKQLSLSFGGGSGKHGVDPPVPQVFMRIQAPRGYPDLFASAFGTKIMAMHLGLGDHTPAIPMIDVQEQAFTFGPQPGRSYYAFPIFFPVGDNRLFVLDNGFDCYLWTPDQHGEEPWGCKNLPRPPFWRSDVSSYGMQPDGCILVSTTQSRAHPHIRRGVRGARTFIFDTNTTKEEESVWKPYGDWVLPFTGRGHYDTSLEGFVGLSKDPETLGYLLYCTTTTGKTSRLDDTGKTLHPCLDLKRTKEKVYNKNPAEEGEHVSATLVHMRPGKFCLVECVSIDKTGQELRVSWVRDFKVPLGGNLDDFVGGPPQGGHFMYRLKTFSLSYDTKGDCLKLKKCKTRCFSLPHEARIGSICMDPVAFWL